LFISLSFFSWCFGCGCAARWPLRGPVFRLRLRRPVARFARSVFRQLEKREALRKRATETPRHRSTASPQWQQAEAVAFGIKGNQAAFLQLLPMILKDAQQGLADGFRSWAQHPKLNDAGKTSPSQSKKPGEVQILGNKDCFICDGVIEYDFIRISYVANIPPMSGCNPERRHEITPAWREIHRR